VTVGLCEWARRHPEWWSIGVGGLACIALALTATRMTPDAAMAGMAMPAPGASAISNSSALLMLALMNTNDPVKLQQVFMQY